MNKYASQLSGESSSQNSIGTSSEVRKQLLEFILLNEAARDLNNIKKAARATSTSL